MPVPFLARRVNMKKMKTMKKMKKIKKSNSDSIRNIKINCILICRLPVPNQFGMAASLCMNSTKELLDLRPTMSSVLDVLWNGRIVDPQPLC